MSKAKIIELPILKEKKRNIKKIKILISQYVPSCANEVIRKIKAEQ